MQCVTTDNWTFTRFKQANFLAMISFGADPESIENDELEYYVTVLENEENEVFQHKFNKLADACMFLNANYGDWAIENQSVSKSGCSSCAAH